MFGVKVKPSSTFKSTINKWIASARKDAEDTAIGLAKDAFRRILYASPQYSGDFVANWNVGIGTPNFSFTENVLGTSPPPYQRGDMKAIGHAQGNANWTGFKLGMQIFLSNSAYSEWTKNYVRKSDGASNSVQLRDHYALKIESGQIKFRSVNGDGSYVMKRAAENTMRRFKHINKASLAALKGQK